MTDREREARIRERKVLDRETFRERLDDVGSMMDDGVPSYGYQPEDAYGEVLAHDAAQRAEIERLREALKGVKRGDCWCGVGIGNPMLGGSHTESCKAAHRALNEGENDG